MSPNERYDFKVKYDQFGVEVVPNFYDRGEELLINKFEEYLLELKSRNKESYSMIELGSNQAYYSVMFKSIFKSNINTAIMVEPYDPYMVRGVEHFRLNNYEGIFINSSIGKRWIAHDVAFNKPETSVDELMKEYSLEKLDVLHSDIDCSETIMLEGASESLKNKKIEYAFILTHGMENHLKCLEIISQYDYDVILDHREDTVGADRLIIIKPKIEQI
jgi:hypothetical protein